MNGFEIVALAASAGDLKALTWVLAALPRDFPAALMVVQHLDPRHRSLMAEILGKRTALRVRQAREGERIEPGLVSIAPPDRHLLVNADGTLSLTQSELVHFTRPSADLLFASMARTQGVRGVGVLLTGMGADGAQGLLTLRTAGGRTIASASDDVRHAADDRETDH